MELSLVTKAIERISLGLPVTICIKLVHIVQLKVVTKVVEDISREYVYLYFIDIKGKRQGTFYMNDRIYCFTVDCCK